jgi:hypothetical protein
LVISVAVSKKGLKKATKHGLSTSQSEEVAVTPNDLYMLDPFPDHTKFERISVLTPWSSKSLKRARVQCGKKPGMKLLRPGFLDFAMTPRESAEPQSSTAATYRLVGYTTVSPPDEWKNSPTSLAKQEPREISVPKEDLVEFEDEEPLFLIVVAPIATGTEKKQVNLCALIWPQSRLFHPHMVSAANFFFRHEYRTHATSKRDCAAEYIANIRNACGVTSTTAAADVADDVATTQPGSSRELGQAEI